MTEPPPVHPFPARSGERGGSVVNNEDSLTASVARL